MSEPETQSAEQRVRALYEGAEAQAADAFEELVAKPSFGLLLARSAENVAALSKLSSDAADLVLRNLRVASRADVTRLARQFNRIEDKLERVLQELEELRDEQKRQHAADASLDREGRIAAEGSNQALNGSATRATGAGAKASSKKNRAAP
jgi:hypothetical protein